MATSGASVTEAHISFSDRLLFSVFWSGLECRLTLLEYAPLIFALTAMHVEELHPVMQIHFMDVSCIPVACLVVVDYPSGCNHFLFIVSILHQVVMSIVHPAKTQGGCVFFEIFGSISKYQGVVLLFNAF